MPLLTLKSILLSNVPELYKKAGENFAQISSYINTNEAYWVAPRIKYFHNSSEKTQKRAIKIYKVKHKIAPELIYELFQEIEHPYNLRINHTFRTCSAKTVQHGNEILLFMGPKIRGFFSF